MTNAMRETTLQTMGLGNVIDMFSAGRLPADAGDLVDQVFGNSASRGALVVSGANGIVGAGKTMQLGSRLAPYGVPIVGLDFPAAPDGIGKQYPGLVRAFGAESAAEIMGNVVRLNYDGKTLPPLLGQMNPRFLLEAIPEILNVKLAHYEIFRSSFPAIEIRSVTSGFPMRELGVGIAHPAFPHEINKMWEIVEEEPSAITHLLWALGLMPIRVSDDWSFVLDVLFCGITLAALRHHHATNMPYWKVDKYVRKLVGPNPFRAHDAIGAAGANFLTWSCLHHLAETYEAEVFRPTPELDEHKETGQNWYPLNHFRPLVDWKFDLEDDEAEFNAWIKGSLYQMTSLMLYEKRAHLSHMNAIGEICAQFRSGILAMARREGADSVIRTVEKYQSLHPDAAGACWHPDVYGAMDSPEWQQLYVNAEHDGEVGVITIGRESYNSDVNQEMNRAIDWLTAAGIENVIVTGDFHLSTQLVGADTSEFYPALEDTAAGARIAGDWSRTARRLNDEFRTSIGFVNGKRCLGGMLELLMHCHYLVAVDDAKLGMPEVTLPVVPGMEGCHWPFRKARADQWPMLFALLLSGSPVNAGDAVGWLVDYAGSTENAMQLVWKLATGGDHGLPARVVQDGPLSGMPTDVSGLPPAGSPGNEAARKAIMQCVQDSCGASLADAVTIQAKHSADFMVGPACKGGAIGADYAKTMAV